MRHLFVLDPLERINPAKDSTAALMQAAFRASLEVWACTPADLIALGDEPLAMAAPVQPDPWVRAGERERLPLNTFKVIWMRKDPPVDEAYLYATHLLDVAERAGVCVLNRPSSLRSWNEKLGALRFSRWMAPTLVSGRVGELQAFAEDHMNDSVDAVVKSVVNSLVNNVVSSLSDSVDVLSNSFSPVPGPVVASDSMLNPSASLFVSKANSKSGGSHLRDLRIENIGNIIVAHLNMTVF